MPVRRIQRGPAAGGPPPGFENSGAWNELYVDGLSNALVVGTGASGSSSQQVLDNATNQTIAGVKTGLVQSKTIAFVEDATSLTHTATVALPAGATLLDILVTNKALWTAAAAVLKVGDTAADDGYFIGVDCKATDLLVGEVLSVSGTTGNWGGKNGAYLVAATGRRGPAATNFGFYYDAGSNIVATMTVTTPATTVGRTFVTVLYTVGTVVAPVLA